jgi:hypothetical protein
MNFGLGHGSRHPVPNVKCVTMGPNLPWRCKKGRIFVIFRLECRIFGGVTPKFVGCRSAESVFWVTGHNPCRIEWNSTVFLDREFVKEGPGSLYFSALSQACTCRLQWVANGVLQTRQGDLSAEWVAVHWRNLTPNYSAILALGG